MTMQSMKALILKRAFDTKKIIDIKEMLNQGYSLDESLDYMYAVTMAQVKEDVTLISVAEGAYKTGASIEYATEVMKNHLIEKYHIEGGKL